MSEEEESVILANKLLDQPNMDPDDDFRMLSRQLLRRHEEITRTGERNRVLTEALKETDRCFGEDDEDKWTNREIHQVLRPIISAALSTGEREP